MSFWSGIVSAFFPIAAPIEQATDAANSAGITDAVYPGVSGSDTGSAPASHPYLDTINNVTTAFKWGVVLILFAAVLYFAWPFLLGLRKRA